MKLFTRMKFSGKLLAPVSLVLATAAGNATAAAPEDMSSAASPYTEHQREPYGPAALVAEGLKNVCLSDEQRAAVERLGKKVSADERAVADAKRALKHAIAAQLMAGEIDRCALQDEIDAYVAAREYASPTLRKALEDLHAILDAKQRNDFVDGIQARVHEMREQSKTWRHALAKDLELTDEQKARIREMLEKAKPELEEERALANAVGEAFRTDEFSMEAIAPVAGVGERTRERAERMVDRAKALCEILTPEQRIALAHRIMARYELTTEPMAEPTTRVTSAALVVEQPETVQQPFVAARRTAAVGGWGGGYAASSTVVRTGYSAGYPIVGGYGPGIW